MGKDGKLRVPCLISKTKPLRCKCKSAVKGFAILAVTMNRSTNLMSPILNCNYVVAIGVSNCPFAIMIQKSGGRLSLRIILGTICLVCSQSVSEIAFFKVPVSLRPSIVKSPKSNRKY